MLKLLFMSEDLSTVLKNHKNKTVFKLSLKIYLKITFYFKFKKVWSHRDVFFLKIYFFYFFVCYGIVEVNHGKCCFYSVISKNMTFFFTFINYLKLIIKNLKKTLNKNHLIKVKENLIKFIRSDMYFNAYLAKLFNTFWTNITNFLFFNLKNNILKHLNINWILTLLNKITSYFSFLNVKRFNILPIIFFSLLVIFILFLCLLL